MKIIEVDENTVKIITSNGISLLIDDNYIEVNGNLIHIKELLPEDSETNEICE